MSTGERLQKVLAAAGLGSRRGLEALIKEGRISVNGQVAELGARVTDTDVIRIDGKVVRNQRTAKPRRRVLLYYKPEGEVTTRDDPEGRRTVYDRLPSITNARWVAVGRLDLNTQGLLIFTTDGELANRLMHPRFGAEREYAIRVLGEIEPTVQRQFLKGVELEDGPAKFLSFKEEGGEGENKWYRGVIGEGRNREVRRLIESQGLVVSRLIRVRFGPIELPRGLRRGMFQELDDQQVDDLARLLDLHVPRKPRTGKSAKRTARTGAKPRTFKTRTRRQGRE